MGDSFLADIPGNRFVMSLGSSGAIASNGAGAVLGQSYFVAPGDLKVLDVRKVGTAAEVTAGTAISSASYRRFVLLNGGTSGTGTTIMASLNNTASGGIGGKKSFATTANNTASDGQILYLSQLTVGAATADGTDAAASAFQLEYQLL
jgi:hypothetical protein